MEMKYTIRILRRASADAEPYWQSFAFSGSPGLSVSDMLDQLNFTDDLLDITGHVASRIAWECSCQQGVCGACAMVVCGVPALACKTRLSVAKNGVVTLEPLSKFPVVRDLCVDRSGLFDILVEKQLWLSTKAVYHQKLLPLQYAAAKCLKCGLCVEVCPNTGMDSKNAGAYLAVECFLKRTVDDDRAMQAQAKAVYAKAFAAGCSKSLSCAAVCPAGIDIKHILCLMNR